MSYLDYEISWTSETCLKLLNNRSKIIQNVRTDEENDHEMDLFSSLGIGFQKGTNHKQAFIYASISRCPRDQINFPARFENMLSFGRI